MLPQGKNGMIRLKKEIMQKGHTLQFNCIDCKQPVHFSVFDVEESRPIACPGCSKKYAFSDPILARQIKKFDALCRQIRDSEEILSHASVGVTCGEHQVKVPYKLLLSRLNSHLDLKIGDQPISITFRIEPVQDVPLKN